MPKLTLTEDKDAPANTAKLEDGKLIVSPEMMREIREFMQQETGDLTVTGAAVDPRPE